MSDSDGEYIEHRSSGDDHEAEFSAAGGPSKTRNAGTRRSKGAVALDGRYRPSTRKGPALAAWEGSLQELKTRDGAGADAGRSVDLARVLEARKRAGIRRDVKPFQRGIIRHQVLVLDMSEAMLEKDMRPNRYLVMLRHVQAYIRDFFEQNPISQLSVHGMYDGKCIQLSELSGNPNDHVMALEDLRTGGREKIPIQPKGAPSLQNALDMSRAILFHTPKHGTREVLIILGALLTNDPGDIGKTIATCAADRLKVSIIGMLARMKVCADIVARTNDGDESGYSVAADEAHLGELLRQSTTPPAARAGDAAAGTANLLVMGFPSRRDEDEPSLCACHGRLVRGGYGCPRCRAKVCALPQTCPACGLTLILSTHLARSYHHLFPLRSFTEVSWARARAAGSLQCKGCLRPFPPVPDVRPDSEGREAGGSLVDGASESARYECETCHNHFCVDCDVFCHQALFNCPGCLSGPPLDVPGDEHAASNGDAMEGVERSVDTA